ncbi:MAG TPA: T9SS type A sorting domain-containing protein [Saprospiraceae bacterium]|nr:T9SS type A sorting domain-containing protein [Saprospiraceae bacterium]HMX85788.1 T9SS type A sorting domain-containing protein [Saprospiraceae bacterium]HMZ72940.1 T9SS type A sorting domain-containing protein [Saprospiraceae bacterium]HNE66080.1 T9SS type A sorting domain-containing protein [Saprospiraceae bacterium]HNL93565.1 T9SS type A sorting domain-containing protein [Saprospiraceae bacterium]
MTITTCAFAGEYSTITSAVAGSTYQFVATGGAGNYITIRQGSPSGTVIGYGNSPLNVTCTVSGSLYMHLNTNSSCGTDASCHTETIQCTSCGSGGSGCPSGLGSYVNITLPYNGTGLTNCGKGNDITSINVSPICGSSSYYGGEDEVYIFTPASTASYTVSFTSSSSWVGLMLYAGCPLTGGGATCAGYAQGSSGNQTITATLTAGVTYYLVVDSWPSPTCHSSYNLSITSGASDPCTSIITLPCGTSTTATLSGSSSWSSSSSCGYSTPGQEKIYSFTPTSSGTATLQVTSASGSYVDYQFKAASGGCSPTGWTCIDDVYTSGSYTFTVTSGVTYYLLLDAETTSTTTHTFQINCPAADPCSSIITLPCGTSTTATLAGSSSWASSSSCGYSTPGQEKIYSFTPTSSGTATLQVTSASGSYVDYQFKAASGGCSPTGWTCIDDVAFTGSFPFTVTAGVTYYILLDAESTSTTTHTFQINCPANDPCSSISTLACGTSTTATLTGSSSWSSSSSCGFSTPGQEKIYSFTPAYSGTATLQVTSASGSYVDYQFKAASGGCSPTGWTCIDDVAGAGSYPFTVTAGVTYYLLLDAETSGTTSHTFQINCPVFDPCTSISTLACGASTTATLTGSSSWASSSTCGFSTPGQENIYSFTPAYSGTATLQVSSASGGFIDYQFKAASGGCSNSGWTCIDDVYIPGSYTFTVTGGVTYYLLLDAETTSTTSHTFQINCPVFDPCSSISTLSCGTSTTATLTGSSSWASSSTCGFSTPGQENIYSFTPTSSGTATLQVSSASGGFIDYQFKAASGGCSNSGWTCIDDVYIPGSYTFTVTGGVTYYLLLDAETTSTVSHSFQINCPTGNITMNCPAPVNVSCAANVPTPNPGSVAASTNCGIPSVNVTFGGDIISNQTCANKYTITRIYNATDMCGNTASCAQIITVNDSTAPTIACPAPVTVSCASLVPPPNPGSITATDNCSGTATVTFVSDVISNQTCANKYTITRTYLATDICGNTATCTQIITVNDATAPTITCPAPVTVSCASLVPPPNPGSIVAADNCSGTATVTFVSDVISNQTCVNKYTITRTYLATDICGNTATCTQIITVNDTSVPTISCPAPVTVSCAESVPPPNPGSVTASDNCGGSLTVVFVGDVISNQTCANKYTITRTYRATDLCGNSATCTQMITVNDITPPSITCPASVTVSCASEVPAPNINLVLASDNCSGAVTKTFVSDVISAQTCVNRYTITRTYRATDVCGNSATCTQIIIVNDQTKPTITCPADVQFSCAGQVPPVNLNLVGASDNCSGAVTKSLVSEVVSNLKCDNNYILTRTYRATDACGNFAECSQKITVFDNVPPTFTSTPASITLECTDVVPAPPIVTATDNCTGIVKIVFKEVSTKSNYLNDCRAYSYKITRTWVATDVCGNSTSIVQTITVQDTKAPEFAFTPPQFITVECDDDGSNNQDPIAFDDCDGNPTVILNVKYKFGLDGCAGSYLATYTWTASDKCGNTAQYTQYITVIDSEAPEIKCPQDIVVTSLVPITVTWPAAKGSDFCDGSVTPVQIQGPPPGSIFPAPSKTVIVYQATDNCGNVSTCSFLVIVKPGTDGYVNTNINKASVANQVTQMAVDAVVGSGTNVLFQNEPNPFENNTVIRFILEKPSFATLQIMDITGKTIKMIQDDYPAGQNSINIDNSQLPASGMYYYQLRTKDFNDTKKMLYIK